MRKVLDVIWGGGKRKYFCKRDSTQNCPTGKSPRRREPPRVPDAVQRPLRCSAEPGPTAQRAARWTPDQQRTAARCAASGERAQRVGTGWVERLAKPITSLNAI